jgi:transposase
MPKETEPTKRSLREIPEVDLSKAKRLPRGKLLAPVARVIHEQTRGPGLLGTDATGIPVLDPDAPDGVRHGTIWAWTNARWVTFFYSPIGDAESVKRFLGPDLARSVHCDGTSITKFLERAGGKRPGCWAHARRRLVEAARAGDRVALEGVRVIAKPFAIERESTSAGDNAEQRRDRRQRSSRPILDDLRDWTARHKAITPPKTPLGQGLGYIERQWPRLLPFLEDGNIEATNNRRERELRRLVLGRKNWLFTWLDDGFGPPTLNKRLRSLADWSLTRARRALARDRQHSGGGARLERRYGLSCQ